jgi:methylated-DNA-[protein]-cysteine S-methyltransferase
MSDIQITYWNSPVGYLEIGADETHLRSIRKVIPPKEACYKAKLPLLIETIAQLDEYFKGRRQKFTIPLYQPGTLFQRAVWDELLTIPYGSRTSYVDIAERIGSPFALRAVGNANGRNRICIIVPCHRVVKLNGNIGGYAYGSDMKKFLLDMERRFLKD